MTPPAGLLAWWPGNGNFQDVIGGFTGVPDGTVTFQSAEVDQGFHLVNSAITATGNFDFSTNNALTIELWFKLNVDTTYNGLVSAENCCTYRLMVDGSGRFYYDAGTHADTSVSTGPAISLGQFHHAAMVVTGGGPAIIYLDGQSVSTNSAGVPAVLPSVSTFLLGAGESATVYTMQDGVLDEISIYNRALAAKEIAAIYAAGAGGKCLPNGGVPGVRMLGPALEARSTGGGLVFSFLSTASQNYTLEGNTDLQTTNWVPVTNLTGDGSLMHITLPATNSWQRFFRLREQ